jgi:hypothetical protein
MCDVSFLIAQSHRSHEAFHFDGLSSETFPDEGGLCDHAFPRLLLALSGTHDLEHLVFCDSADLG